MPTLMLRDLTDELKAQIVAYANRRGVAVKEAAIALIRLGLQASAARSAGADAVNQALSPEARSERMRALARKRWPDNS